VTTELRKIFLKHLSTQVARNKISEFSNLSPICGFIFQRSDTVSHFDHNDFFAAAPRIKSRAGVTGAAF